MTDRTLAFGVLASDFCSPLAWTDRWWIVSPPALGAKQDSYRAC